MSAAFETPIGTRQVPMQADHLEVPQLQLLQALPQLLPVPIQEAQYANQQLFVV